MANSSETPLHPGAGANRLSDRFAEDAPSAYHPLTEREELVATAIVDSAFAVHKTLGPGLLERVYEVCFCYELSKRGFTPKRQVDIPIIYDGVVLEDGLRADVVVDECAVCELKSVVEMNPVFEAQILSHMKLMKIRLGFLINFNVPLIKHGIRRRVL
jgi:GxxExxY protein